MDMNRDMAIRKKDGRMILLINGEMLWMETDMFTVDGTIVKPDGTLILPDGKTSMLGEDEAILIDTTITGIAES
jgi:hypothetical protein